MFAKLVIGVVGLLVIAVVVVVFLGSRLPVAHVATRSLVVPAPPDSVFAVLTDFAAAPAWRTALTAVELDPPGADGRTRFTEVAGSERLSFVVEKKEPPNRLVTRITGTGRAFGGAWAFALEEIPGGTQITITEHGEVYNPLFRFVSAYVMGHSATLERYLKDLAAKFGVPATIVTGTTVPA